jgi:hypothetical protein
VGIRMGREMKNGEEQRFFQRKAYPQICGHTTSLKIFVYRKKFDIIKVD